MDYDAAFREIIEHLWLHEADHVDYIHAMRLGKNSSIHEAILISGTIVLQCRIRKKKFIIEYRGGLLTAKVPLKAEEEYLQACLRVFRSVVFAARYAGMRSEVTA